MFAVFIIVEVEGGFAATTRAADRGEAGRIGLPGGKLDPGESPEAAALREAEEEGWACEGPLVHVHTGVVEGRPVAWYAAKSATKLAGHKEAGRVEPMIACRAEIAGSGYGNDEAMRAYSHRFFERIAEKSDSAWFWCGKGEPL